MKYRAEIDGLRAVAVLPVILFHAGFKLFGGGYVGVDVFFVLSGYLITGIIHEEMQSGRFSVVRFYERRARRILPALLLVCLVCIPFAWLWMLPDELQGFARSLMAVSVFASNFLFWSESGYFEAAAALKPLLHTWSLAVEEQFYIFFPLFLLLLRRASPRTLMTVIAALSVVSLSAAELLSKLLPAANFYLLPSRAWELGLGAILALNAGTMSRKHGYAGQLAAATGLAMIVYAVFAFDETMQLPGLWSLIPVLGTALLVAFATPSTMIGWFLSLRPIVGIGLISYSAYLWHQPLFAFARIRLLDAPSPATYMVLSALALVLAYLSWRFVEQPFRRKDLVSRRQIFSSAAAVSVLVIAAGFAGQETSGFPARLTSDALAMAAWAEQPKLRQGKCKTGSLNIVTPENSCLYNDELPADITIWGDSHATVLAQSLADALRTGDHGLREFSFYGCAPATGLHRSDGVDDCDALNRRVLRELDPVSTVVLLARWTLYLEGEPFDNREGGVEPDGATYALPLGKGREYIADPARVQVVGQLFRTTIEQLLKSGKRVVLVYPVPEVGWNVPRLLAREIQFGIGRQSPLSTSFEVFRRRSGNARAQLDLLADNPNLLRVRPEELFCGTHIADRCLAQLDGKPLYFDDDHLSGIGSAMLAGKIVAAMKEKLWLN